MNPVYKKQFVAIKRCLGIESIISIRFSDTKTANFKKFKDTACTALARCLKGGHCTHIDRQSGQLCSGGNFFLGIDNLSNEEVCKVYAEEEKIFADKRACFSFLNTLPKYPEYLKEKRYILFAPLKKEDSKPDVIVLLATPAQASRILGLSIYNGMLSPQVIPAISTCACIYAPLASDRIHINFIDYYDRYYQGRQDGKLLWNDHELLISMPFPIFQQIIENLPNSCHGNLKPEINSKKFDAMETNRAS